MQLLYRKVVAAGPGEEAGVRRRWVAGIGVSRRCSLMLHGGGFDAARASRGDQVSRCIRVGGNDSPPVTGCSVRSLHRPHRKQCTPRLREDNFHREHSFSSHSPLYIGQKLKGSFVSPLFAWTYFRVRACGTAGVTVRTVLTCEGRGLVPRRPKRIRGRMMRWWA